MMLVVYAIFTALMTCALFISWFFARRKMQAVETELRKPVEELKVFIELLDLETQFLKLKEEGEFIPCPNLESSFDGVVAFLREQHQPLDPPLDSIVISKAPKGVSSLSADELERCSQKVADLMTQKERIIFKILLLRFPETAYIVCRDGFSFDDTSYLDKIRKAASRLSVKFSVDIFFFRFLCNLRKLFLQKDCESASELETKENVDDIFEIKKRLSNAAQPA